MALQLFGVVATLFSFTSTPVFCEAAPADSTIPVAVTADSTLQALYAGGESFDSFLAKAKARREMWVKNWDGGVVPADALEHARAVRGKWRLLVVAVDSCSDSVNTVPYVAKLVSQVPGLEMRIVNPTVGKQIMEAHRTPDGRAATPTVLVLDADGNDVGCWIERPTVLQQGVIDARAAGKADEFLRDKQKWYDADAGASTIREVVAMIEGAASGKSVCAAKSKP